MVKRMKAFLFLRGKGLLSNRSLLLQILMPAVILYMYRYIYSLDILNEVPKKQLLLFCAPFTIVLAAGSLIAIILAEEKEKNNYRELRLNGVSIDEYCVSVIIYPIFIAVIYMIAIPLFLDISFTNSLVIGYVLAVNSITLVIVLLYLLIGLVVKTQIAAQVMSIPLMLIIIFLPTVSLIDPKFEIVTEYSFMGFFTDYVNDWEKFSLINKTKESVIYLGWVVILLSGIYYYKRLDSDFIEK